MLCYILHIFSFNSCDWTSGVGRLDLYIIFVSIKCASINYRTDDGNCQLLAENTQTATISSSDSQWRYSDVRPDCAAGCISLLV